MELSTEGGSSAKVSKGGSEFFYRLLGWSALRRERGAWSE